MKLSEDYSGEYSYWHTDRKRFRGYSCCRYRQEIRRLVEQTGSKKLLDYGCGKGQQYKVDRIHKVWGVPVPHCYDPGVWKFNRKPRGKFDGVICCDVMEHIAEPDVDKVLKDIFGYAEKFVFFSISVFESSKRWRDGRSVHLTVKEPEWWMDRLVHNSTDVVMQVDFDIRGCE